METLEVNRAMTQDEAKALKNGKVDVRKPTDLPPSFIAKDAATGVPFAMVTQGHPDAIEKQRAAFMRARKLYTGVTRAGGMRSKSGTFGFVGANATMQRISPSAAAWSYQDPVSHAVICDYAADLQAVIDDEGPENARIAAGESLTELHPDWRLGGSPWTSGIVNDTANLYYHYDKNNYPGVWSAMVVVRAGTRGGHLHIADYDLTLKCSDGDLVYFPGMELMHGVTPITSSLKGGYRFTSVYYSVKRFQGKPGMEDSLKDASATRAGLEDDLIARQRQSGMIR